MKNVLDTIAVKMCKKLFSIHRFLEFCISELDRGNCMNVGPRPIIHSFHSVLVIIKYIEFVSPSDRQYV